MASSTNGLIGPNDLVITLDSIAAWLKYAVGPLGQGLPSESSVHSLAYQSLLAQSKILGDGVSNFGVANSTLQFGLTQKLSSLYVSSRYEALANNLLRPMVGEINSELSNPAVLPKYLSGTNTVQWQMTGNNLSAIDAHLQRMNATNSGVPATPVGTPTLTQSTGGSLPNTSSGSAPVVCYTFVGANDWLESQPSPVSTQVALTGANNAYLIGGMSTVPVGVTKIRFYRSAFGTTTPLLYDSEVAVAVGAAPTTIKFTRPDIALLPSVTPPVWAQAMMLPEAALAIAVCSMSNSNGNPLGSFTISNSGMLSASNVVLGPVNGILGYGNPASSGTYASWNAGSSTFGSIQTTNSIAQGVQGFFGSFAIQARTVVTLDANASISSIAYTYVTAASPLTPLTGTLAGPFTLNLAAGSTVDLAVPAGRCVKSITGLTVGTSTTGQIVLEAEPLRSI